MQTSEMPIVKDLVLTAKILRITNSSFYESVSEVKITSLPSIS